MINTGRFQNCVCRASNVPSELCDGELTFREKGKQVTLSLRRGEEAKAIVIDGCVCSDQNRRCDGLFLYKRSNKRWMILVELKGSHIDDAFEQLASTRSRSEYHEIVDLFQEGRNHSITHLAFIISNHLFSKIDKQKYESRYGFRVKGVLLGAATSPIPDLRKYL
jgi:hypothetical protein